MLNLHFPITGVRLFFVSLLIALLAAVFLTMSSAQTITRAQDNPSPTPDYASLLISDGNPGDIVDTTDIHVSAADGGVSGTASGGGSIDTCQDGLPALPYFNMTKIPGNGPTGIALDTFPPDANTPYRWPGFQPFEPVLLVRYSSDQIPLPTTDPNVPPTDIPAYGTTGGQRSPSFKFTGVTIVPLHANKNGTVVLNQAILTVLKSNNRDGSNPDSFTNAVVVGINGKVAGCLYDAQVAVAPYNDLNTFFGKLYPPKKLEIVKPTIAALPTLAPALTRAPPPSAVPPTDVAAPAAVTTAPTPFPITCDGFNLPSRLAPNEQAQVTPGDANSVNSEPSKLSDSKTNQRIGHIPGEGVFQILNADPVCEGGIIWWNIQYGDLVGWTGEGQGDTYWLQPLASTTNTAVNNIPPTAPLVVVPAVPAATQGRNSVQIVAVVPDTKMPLAVNASVTVALIYNLTSDNIVAKGGYTMGVWFERFSDVKCQNLLSVNNNTSIDTTFGSQAMTVNADKMVLKTQAAILDGPYVAVEARVYANGSVLQDAADLNNQYCFQVFAK